MSKPIHVLVLDQNSARASALLAALQTAGCRVSLASDLGLDLPEAIGRLAIDLVIVDIADPDRDAIDQMGSLAHSSGQPVLLFCDRADQSLAKRAIRSGVAAYAVDGVMPTRIRPILDLAIAQFEAIQGLKDELAAARLSLAERKVIDRAKGLLMAKRGLSEAAAYRELRKMAMDRGRKLADTAEDVIALMKLIGG